MLFDKSVDPLLRRFQIQFVLVNLAFVLIVLLAVLVLSGYGSYLQRVDDVYTELDESVNRVERIMGGKYNVLDLDSGFNPQDRQPGASRPDADQLFAGGQRDVGFDPVIATSTYVVDNRGKLVAIAFDQLDLDESTFAEAFVEVVEQRPEAAGRPFGSHGDIRGAIKSLDLYYQMCSVPGGYCISLASGAYVNRGVAAMVRTLLVVESLALLVFAALSIVLSRWVVGPVERAWQQQHQFIADASHELKTPLAVIRANDSLLMASPQATVASQMQWIESTEAEANLMQDLVNDMLYLAQSENVQNEVVQTQVDFTNLVQATVLQFESVAFEKNVVIQDSVAPDVNVMGESKSLGRMVATLVDNACKYASEGGTVKVSLWKQGSTCNLRVHNTGTFIPEEDLPHVFDRFYRSDKARNQAQGGFGLGLAIAKSIIDEHKGSIAVASNGSDGTAFTVMLPTA